MTTGSSKGRDDGGEAASSTLPFDPRELMAMRVRPAQFARMCKVSKTAVSGWIKRGTITLGPDGLLDPTVASRQVFQNTDPARLRAHVFKMAAASHDELRKRVRVLEAELSQAKHLVKHVRYQVEDKHARQVKQMADEIEDRFAELVKANQAGELYEALEALLDAVFYPDAPTG